MGIQLQQVTDYIKSLYPGENPVALHAPRFIGKEKQYLSECIDSTFVSYVGPFVTRFENEIRSFTGAGHAVATSSGTAALHVALMLVGVDADSEVITQPLTFVGTANAVAYTGARCAFIDCDASTLGMSPDALRAYLQNVAEIRAGICINKRTGQRIAACLPVHVFGHPVRIDEICEVCHSYGIPVVEDAAESLGSWYKGVHTGTFGRIGVLSFNGNKIVTTGGGGMIITNDETLASQARHITTTAKVPHPYEFVHDRIGYNYRMPNINAAVGCAQLESLSFFLERKRELATLYRDFFRDTGVQWVNEPADAKSNFWLNAVLLADKKERDSFLEFANKNGVMTRPAWTLMSLLPMFGGGDLNDTPVAVNLADRLVNIPSSVRLQ